MTATHHTALYRFSFPDAAPNTSPAPQSGPHTREQNGHGEPIPPSSGPLVLIDLTDLDGSRTGGGVSVTVRAGGNDGARITGAGQFRPSFGTGRFGAFFCADVRGARVRRSGTFLGDVPDAATQELGDDGDGGGAGARVPAGSAGGWVQFDKVTAPGGALVVRVGVSFVSRARACAHAEREVPGFGFEGTVVAAEAAWREKLGAVRVDGAGVEPGLLVTFWSGLYRTMLSPQDYTGENTLWESAEPYFDS